MEFGPRQRTRNWSDSSPWVWTRRWNNTTATMCSSSYPPLNWTHFLKSWFRMCSHVRNLNWWPLQLVPPPRSHCISLSLVKIPTLLKEISRLWFVLHVVVRVMKWLVVIATLLDGGVADQETNSQSRLPSLLLLRDLALTPLKLQSQHH